MLLGLGDRQRLAPGVERGLSLIALGPGEVAISVAEVLICVPDRSGRGLVDEIGAPAGLGRVADVAMGRCDSLLGVPSAALGVREGLARVAGGALGVVDGP